MDAQTVWKMAYSQLEIQLDRASFDTWLRDAVLLDHQQDETKQVLVVGVRNTYARDMLAHRLYRTVRRVVSDVVGAPVEVRFEVHRLRAASGEESEEMPLFKLLAQQQAASDAPPLPLHQQMTRPQRPTPVESELNPRFTFERFIMSDQNRISYEAARAVAEMPGAAYNPLLIYGGVGMGKTHLLQAVGHACQQRGQRVIYIPSEAFTNDLVDAIRQRTTAMFREKYRSADVLLVDDIQFMASKESTQEEFFHTFNALVTFNKQIVLASDRHPQQLMALEDRLRSRFAGGLVVDVPAADLETRMAILRMWAQEKQFELDEETVYMVAQRAPKNIRELEGVFNQIIAKSKLTQQPITMNQAALTVERYERPRQRVTLARVLDATARYHNLSLEDLMGQSRSGPINQARQIAMYLAREITDASLPQIGEAIGGRTHTTVLHGCNKVAADMQKDDELCTAVDTIRRQLFKHW
ncbi:MAG: chromosomal replication initiator protein DnaA [Chloroflexi bacterium]|nr:chromosomal replication initiator protein DnaA [Chloroflexota bacterium]